MSAVSRSYARGLTIVSGTVALSAALCLLRVDVGAGPPPAGRDLGDGGPRLGPFALLDQDGRPVTDRDTAGRTWIAAFIFTRCPASCPRISAVMRGVQDRLAGTSVGLVSLTVDPQRDTPEVLARYAKGLGADPARWRFWTGPKEAVYRLILEGFRVPVQPATPEAAAAGAEDVAHSERLVLVAPGNRVAGYFDATDPQAVRDLVGRAKALGRPAAPAWAGRLPAVNASLNATATALLLAAWGLIRTRHVRGHIACMIAALAVSALFLGCYLVYHGTIGGGVPFRGVGPVRLLYFTILLSHVVLAAVIVPLIAATVWRAWKRRWSDHARIAALTFPVWLYVSVTGVVVYWMLYRMDLGASYGPG